MADDFSEAGYTELLATFLDLGYASVSYETANPSKKHLIVRHDIDMSLQAALPIAESEQELGVTAHYFVLVRTEMYNLFSAASQKALNRIAELGHEIGLHFDASFYGGDISVFDKAAEEECSVIEAATSRAVKCISFHRPDKGLLGLEGTLGGRIHAYQPRFFTEMGYCSDSHGGWHFGHPLKHDAVREGRALQLLTHPIWWTGSMSEGPVARLDQFTDDSLQRLRAELAENCEPYRNREKLTVT